MQFSIQLSVQKWYDEYVLYIYIYVYVCVRLCFVLVLS